MHTRTRRGAVVGAVIGLALSATLPAAATGGEDARGNCTNNSSWRLKADTHDGRIEVEGRVEAPRSGQRWTWKILHDGYVSFHGHATASGGSVRVERQVIDTPGYDAIGWRAKNARTGERCRGHVTI